MLPNNIKPFLFQAIYDYVVDQGLTPLVVINAKSPGVYVPMENVDKQTGCIALNISPKAVRDFESIGIGIAFRTTFSGVQKTVQVTYDSMMLLQIKETGGYYHLAAKMDDFSAELNKALAIETPGFEVEGEESVEDKINKWTRERISRLKESERAREESDDDDDQDDEDGEGGSAGFSIVTEGRD